MQRTSITGAGGSGFPGQLRQRYAVHLNIYHSNHYVSYTAGGGSNEQDCLLCEVCLPSGLTTALYVG
jgi:hypothetical protein